MTPKTKIYLVTHGEEGDLRGVNALYRVLNRSPKSNFDTKKSYLLITTQKFILFFTKTKFKTCKSQNFEFESIVVVSGRIFVSL